MVSLAIDLSPSMPADSGSGRHHAVGRPLDDASRLPMERTLAALGSDDRYRASPSLSGIGSANRRPHHEQATMLDTGLKPFLLVAAAFALILVNALWVAAEFAIVRVRRTRLEELSGQGVEAAKSAIVVIDGIGDYLALTQIGITIASLGVGWLAEDAVVQSLRLLRPDLGPSTGVAHAFAIGLAFVLVTMMHVVLGEQVPKMLAVSNAERYLLSLAPLLRAAHFIFKPLLRVLERLSSWILQVLRHGVAVHAPISEDEL